VVLLVVLLVGFGEGEMFHSFVWGRESGIMYYILKRGRMGVETGEGKRRSRIDDVTIVHHEYFMDFE